MLLRAQISIDIEAADFVEAAEHQRMLETLLTDVRARYGDAVLDIRERRNRGLPASDARPSVRRAYEPNTGRLHAYVD